MNNYLNNSIFIPDKPYSRAKNDREIKPIEQPAKVLMLKKSTLIRSLILALTFSCAQSHALDPYWGKWLSAAIGTVGIITTFFKKDVYALYLASKAAQDPLCKTYYKEVYKDKTIGLNDLWEGHKALRKMKSFDQLKILVGLHMTGKAVKKTYKDCADKIKQSSVASSFNRAYEGYASSAKNIWHRFDRNTKGQKPQQSASHTARMILHGATLGTSYLIEQAFDTQTRHQHQANASDTLRSAYESPKRIAKEAAQGLKQTARTTGECLGDMCNWYSNAFKRTYATAKLEAANTNNRMKESFKKQQQFARNSTTSLKTQCALQ